MDEIRVTKLKMAHALRSKFNYNVGLDRIDYKYGVIAPALAAIDKNATVGELPVFLPLELNANTDNN